MLLRVSAPTEPSARPTESPSIVLVLAGKCIYNFRVFNMPL